jgi:hypothetical protein
MDNIFQSIFFTGQPSVQRSVISKSVDQTNGGKEKDPDVTY